MGKIIDLLKVFAEKHLIPAIISIAVAILGVALCPNVLGIEDKVGSALYGLLIFCLCFSFIQFLVWLFNRIKAARKKGKAKTRNREFETRQEKEALEHLWDYVDSLSPQDKKHLKTFLETDNEPIEIEGEFFGYGLLSNNRIVVCTNKPSEPKMENTLTVKTNKNSVPIDFTKMIYSTPTKLYRLKDDFFELLKYSNDQYHKISHFDLEEQ